MGKLIIDSEFWKLFPQGKIGVVICRNVNNAYGSKMQDYENQIKIAEKIAKKKLENCEFLENNTVKNWREAYKKFKTKKGARCSIELLLKRVYNDNPLKNINPLVDIYNTFSLKYFIPCGGEDMDTFIGDLKLTKATGEENFIPLGSLENEPPLIDEIVYKDDFGVVCRSLNWRESSKNMITENTKNVLFCTEIIEDIDDEKLTIILNELGFDVTDKLGGTFKIEILSNEKAEVNM